MRQAQVLHHGAAERRRLQQRGCDEALRRLRLLELNGREHEAAVQQKAAGSGSSAPLSSALPAARSGSSGSPALRTADCSTVRGWAEEADRRRQEAQSRHVHARGQLSCRQPVHILPSHPAQRPRDGGRRDRLGRCVHRPVSSSARIEKEIAHGGCAGKRRSRGGVPRLPPPIRAICLAIEDQLGVGMAVGLTSSTNGAWKEGRLTTG